MLSRICMWGKLIYSWLTATAGLAAMGQGAARRRVAAERGIDVRGGRSSSSRRGQPVRPRLRAGARALRFRGVEVEGLRAMIETLETRRLLSALPVTHDPVDAPPPAIRVVTLE